MNLRPNDRAATTIQVTVSNKLLPNGKPLYRTFRTDQFSCAYDKALEWGEPIEEALVKGFVPASAVEQKPVVAQRRDDTFNSPTFLQMLREFEAQPHAKLSNSFREVAGYLLQEIAQVRFHEMTMEWVHARLDYYKNVKEYSPGTVRKRIEALSNIHAYTRTKISGGLKHQSICELLPMNYAKRADFTASKTQLDQIAERPLTPEREAAIRAVFSGEKTIPTKSIKSLRDQKLEVLFTLISNTGMRLQEAYLLRVDALNFKQFIINVGGSKGWYGENKPRSTFMRKRVRESLAAYIEANHFRPEDFLFRDGWWDGDCASENAYERKKARKATSSYLSGLFRSLYKAAGIEGLREHDLRHEATIRYIEMEQDGKAVYNREDLKKMMGWTSDKMVSHYLSKWRPEIGSSRVSADL
jgi:integrase